MIRNIRIYIVRKAYESALSQRISYDSQQISNQSWNVLIAVAYHNREMKLANRLARLINPDAILRAF